MKRRAFLRSAVAAVTSSMVTASAFAGGSADNRRLDRIGIQLYTVRKYMAENVPATLRRLRDIGYNEVEFAGYFEHDPTEIKAMLEDLGLSSPAAHARFQDARAEPQRFIDDFLTVGHKFFVIPAIPKKERVRIDQYKEHAETFNGIAERCAESGLSFAYHNHAFEFENMDGVLPYDVLLQETDPTLVKMELDTYWFKKAGVDPFAYFAQHPGRFSLCHVKDMAADGSIADVGDGVIDFARLFAASDKAGFQHFFVEHDRPAAPFETAERSLSALSELEFQA